MKKYLQLQAKKSLSLFLTVLMLLSCWVWIAPERVEAANTAAEGYYYFRIRGNVTDNAEAGMDVHYAMVNDVKYTTTNTMSSTGVQTLVEGWCKGFPTKVTYYVGTPAQDCGSADGKAENVHVQVRVDGTDTWYTLNNKGESTGHTFLADADDYDWTFDDLGQNLPYITKVGSVSAESELTIPDINSTSTVSTTPFNLTLWDQYNTMCMSETDMKNISYILGQSENDTTDISDKNKGFYLEKTDSGIKATITEQMQKSWTTETGKTTATYYINASLQKDGKTWKVSKKIPVKYPTYKVTVDSNGGALADNNGGSITGTWVNEGIYGADKTPYPTGEAGTRAGYTFQGIWTDKQPGEGSASINAESFPKLVSKSEYDAIEGATVDEYGVKTVTATGEKYYSAGTKWTADSRKVTGKKDYYAWWSAADITVKFYDIDGSYLRSVVYKYGQTIGAKEHPVSDYDVENGKYESGAFVYQGFKNWRDIDGTDITADFGFGTDGKTTYSLTPVFGKVYNNKYTFTFNMPDGSAVKKENLTYRSTVTKPVAAVPNDLLKGLDYSYSFKGWTAQAPANGAKYHLVDVGNTAISINNDWIVRTDASFYPVIEREIKEYYVKFNYINAIGDETSVVEKVAYGSPIDTPAAVNRKYASEGYEYALEVWTSDDLKANIKFEVDSVLIFNSANFSIDAGNLSEADPVVLDAAYDEGTEKPYTITFKYKKADGTQGIYEIPVTHGYFIVADSVTALKKLVPTEYSDGERLYNFQWSWVITEGKGTNESGESVTSCSYSGLEEFSPVSNVTFEAEYNEGTPYYTVEYVFGAQGYTKDVLLGDPVPAWTVETTDEDGNTTVEVFEPMDEEVETGTYVFEGWYDEEQKDPERKQTNGKKYTLADIVTGDLKLYPQYKFEPKKFQIKFMNFDGSVQLAIAKVEVGQSFEVAFAEAQRAAQLRDDDETYEYTFIGWDNKVPDNYLCEGKDMTYTALYRADYLYYEAQWLTAENGAVATTTKHTYNSQVYNPAVNFAAPEGKVFAGWCYRDKDGNEHAFVRGMKITSDMTFYAVYEAAITKYTLTTIVNGTETKYEVIAGKKAEAVPTPVSGWKDATYHQAFKGWYTDAAFTEEFKIDKTAITANITIYAKYETEMHSTLVEDGEPERALVKAPDFAYKYENADDAKGEEKIWCSCSEATAKYVAIPALEDTVAPTGVIYLGGNKWSSTDAASGAEDKNQYVVNGDAKVVLTITDTADVDAAYNPAGLGSGLRLIRAFVSGDTFTQSQQGIAAQLATTIFTAATENGKVVVQNTANYTFKVSDLVIADLDAAGNVQHDEDGNILTKDLEDGQEYIIYYYAVDNSGKVLNTNVRTAKFTYDITAPAITVTGIGNTEKVKTFCGTATITNIEEGATLVVNDETIELNGADEYAITAAGEYIIKLTDKAGNSRSEKIKVNDGHIEVRSKKSVTCTEDGYEKVVCAICNTVISEEVDAHEGHKFEYKTTEATCTQPAKKTGACTVCGTKTAEEIVSPALDHSFTDYTVEKEPTCSTDGLKVAICDNGCGEKKEESIAATPGENHAWGPVKTIRPTCTEDGYQYKACKYCDVAPVIIEDSEVEATGHVSTETLITVYPTCNTAGAKEERCTKCGTLVGDPTAIPATGNHKWVASTDSTETFEPTTEAKGQIIYYCANEGCGASKVEEIDKIVKYTVNFYFDSEADIPTFSFKNKTVGEVIDEADVVLRDEETGKVILPKKASTETLTFKFAGWADENGTAVKFPIEVASDMEIYPVFKSSTRIYTHKFLVTTTWGESTASREASDMQYAEIIGVYGETMKAPATIPVFTHSDPAEDARLKSLYTFRFLGWSTTGSAEDIDNTFEMTEDRTYYAVFNAIPNNFTVIFYDEDGRTVLDSTSVPTGGSATYKGETPKKADDGEKHYAFEGWRYNNSIVAVNYVVENITANTKLTAVYTGETHTFIKYSEYDENGKDILNYESTCTAEGLETKKCACGWEVSTKLPMKEHTYVEQPDGSKKCECGATIAAETKKVTIKFVDDEGNELKTVAVAEGDTYTFSAPDKAMTAQYTYAFAYWLDANNNIITTDKSITITAGSEEATYKAYYSFKVRSYNVIYFDANGDIADSFTVEYGKAVPAYSVVDDKGNIVYPAKKFNDANHYEFKEWNLTKGSDALTVKGQTEFKPVFDPVPHNFVTQTVPATCTNTGGEKDICACGCEKVIGQVIPTIPHSVGTIVEDVKPALGKPGYKIYKCSMCGGEIREDYAALSSAIIKIRVYDNNGEYANGAAVELYYTVNGEEVQYVIVKDNVVIDDYLTKDGFVQITVPGEYSNWRAKIYYNGGSYNGVVNTGDAENVFGTPKATEPDDGDDNDNDGKDDCSCTCHKNTFWGIIFRLFQKIVKAFTGKAKCCSDPDKRI